MYLKSRSRLVGLGLLLALSFAAAGRNVAQEERVDRQAWPKELESAGSKITIYEPQVDSLKGTRLSSRAALSVVPEGATDPVFGAIWLDATLVTDADGKWGRPENLRIAEMRFPTGKAQSLSGLREAVAAEISRWNLTYSMNTLLAEVRQLEERKASAAALKAEVPEIQFRSHPAVLVTIDGDPEWRAVPGKGLQRLANTAFFVVEEGEAAKCYLRISPFWWSAASALGPWQPVEDVPGAVGELWKKEPRPQMAQDEDREADPRRPEVITSTRPAELVWTDGLPQYAPIAGTDLLYVKNTSSDIFLEISTQNSYVLLSGRWFKTESSKVAWEFVASDRLPHDFARIPIGSEKQHVLACVAGTPEARDAVKNAEIPQTEAVKPGPAPDLQATYDGEPQFTQIPDSSVRYAVNSPSPIFNVDRRYYWCEDGIWYDSDYAVGPWGVSSYVPWSIYCIPPSCPFYYVTYCRIFSVSPYAISFGYYPGYRGCYVWGPTIVYGTGWRYRWWCGASCYVRPCTWGIGVRWSSGACSWTFSLGWGSSSAWSGVSTYRRAPSIAVGVGGGCNVRTALGYRNSVGVDVAVPVHQSRPDNLYVRQPNRILRPVPPAESVGVIRKPGVVKDPPPAASHGRDLRLRDPDAIPRENARSRDLVRPKDPDNRDPQDHRDLVPRTPRREDRAASESVPRDNVVRPRDVQRPAGPERDSRDPGNFRREDREPQTPPPPPRVERHEPQPPPAPQVERREPAPAPRTPPPVEHRAPPPPPREERREPPPAPREERREPPHSPPPVEHREAPRSPPPPPQQSHDSGRSNDRGSNHRKGSNNNSK
jgi:hypothetical protein